MSERFPFPIPDGWYGLLYSHELPRGEVLRLPLLDTELVAFRGESGEAHVLDAYCPHLGAHLGVGGAVVGDALRCPFHAWEWDGASGDCTRIPYAERIPPNARIRSWPCVERNGVILAWYHADGKPPSFEIPDVAEATSPEWSEPDCHEFIVKSHNQEMGENAVDSAHFRYVHGTLNVPPSEVVEDGSLRVTTQTIEMKTPRGRRERIDHDPPVRNGLLHHALHGNLRDLRDRLYHPDRPGDRAAPVHVPTAARGREGSGRRGRRGADPRPHQADPRGHPDLGGEGASRPPPALRRRRPDPGLSPLVRTVLQRVAGLSPDEPSAGILVRLGR